MVSFVSKVEAASESEAIELFANGEGELIGHSIGDQTGDIEHEEVAITWRQAGMMMLGYREIGRLYTPAEAEEAHKVRQERRMRPVQIVGSEA